jgi:hypothetical protein
MGAARDVFLAVGSLFEHFAVAGQDGYDACKLLPVYFLLHRRAEPLKSLRADLPRALGRGFGGI